MGSSRINRGGGAPPPRITGHSRRRPSGLDLKLTEPTPEPIRAMDRARVAA
jgi:hypothetical protein